MNREIAKIRSTTLGIEDHGILTAMLELDYGGTVQGAGGYALDQYDEGQERRVGHRAAGDFILGVLRACGVDSWEKVAGRTVYALRDEGFHGKVIGLAPLPTERGEEFLFESIVGPWLMGN